MQASLCSTRGLVCISTVPAKQQVPTHARLTATAGRSVVPSLCRTSAAAAQAAAATGARWVTPFLSPWRATVRAVGGEDWDGNAAGDAAFAMRVKALACTAPLHDLDVRKSSIQIGDYAVYQMSELALQAIDLVTIAMDFDTGARPSKVIADLSAIAATHAPDRAGIEHEAVARWVLENQLNVGTADRGFRTIYGIDTAQGYDRRSFDFKLARGDPRRRRRAVLTGLERGGERPGRRA